MHFKDDVIAFIGPACAFALEPVARLAAYWNTPIITGMGDQVINFIYAVPRLPSNIHQLKKIEHEIYSTMLRCCDEFMCAAYHYKIILE